MTGWLILAVYIVGFLFTYPRAYAVVDASVRDDFGDNDDPTDRAMTAVAGLGFASIWPLAAVAWTVYRFLTPTTPGMRRADLDAREQRIAAMERELGIGRDR